MASRDAVGNIVKNNICIGGDRTRMQVQNSEIQRRQWIPDERDNFISWLRGEFAAANAIIDALCQHLRIVGEPAEYDFVLTCIQQRRYNWTVVLHMQQYFSVAEVMFALQQVAWRKQQRNSDHFSGAQFNREFNEKDNASSRIDTQGSTNHGRAREGSASRPTESVKKSGHQISFSRKGSKDGGCVSGGSCEDKREDVGINADAPACDAVSANSALHPVEGRGNLSGSRISECEKNASPSFSSVSSGKLKRGDGANQGGEERPGLENNGSNGTKEHEESNLPDSEQNDASQKGRRSKAAEVNPGRPKALGNACVTHQSGSYGDISSNLDFQFVSKQEEDRRRAMVLASKNFVGNELLEGKMVNVVEGLELYESIFDSSELPQLIHLTQELKISGRRGELRGQTFVVSKRPMKGNGREMIQLGVPIVDGPLEEENAIKTLKDGVVEPIPTVLQGVIDRLLQWQIIPANRRPDCCIINFFNEGDHSQPHISPPYFERPFCMMSLLLDCTMVFGRVIAMHHPGDYKGTLRISLPAGSLLVMQGNSADIARHAISSSAGQRVTITFVKVQPKKAPTFPTIPTGISHPSSMPMTHWVPSIGRQPSANASAPFSSLGRGVSHATAKRHNAVPTSGVLPVPPVHSSQMPQHLPASGIQPLFAGPTGPVGAYSPLAIVAPGWSAVTRPTPRMPSSGTGVFLPCSGSGNSPGQPEVLPQQQQGVLVLSPGLPKGESSAAASAESPGASCSTVRSSKSTAPNQFAFDNLDRDSEKANALSSLRPLPGKMDSTVTRKALGKDIVNRSPKLDSNESRIIKDDQTNRTPNQAKRTANKLNLIGPGGGAVR